MLSNDVWRIAIDVEMEPYEEALSIIRGDLLTVGERKQEFTYNSELKLIDTLLKTMETKLQTFKQILPKLDPRRGLINFGGAMLKALFGTAVDSDITSLHNNFDELQLRQQDIVHSVANQLTYIKKLDTITSVNADAIANLSGIIRDDMIKSHDKFREITRDILWLNMTIYGQSALFMTIRQLELAVLQLTQQLDELMDAIQSIIMGKLPVNLINPTTLHNILKNVSLHLPENYELIAGARIENIHLYYDFITVAAVGDAHHIKLILNVPLKTANRHFVLYKILALPTRISNDTFVQYLPEFLFFGIDTVQHNYILFTEAELSHCTQSSITVCPANAAIYSTQMKTCELSLYLQTTDSQNLCHRRLLLHHKTPILQRYESTWIYHLPERQHVVLRCWKDKAWTSSTHILYGNGIIYNTSQCLLTTDKFQTLPNIIGNTQATIDPTKLYVPDQVAIVTNHELQALEEAIPAEIAHLDDVRSRVAMPRRIIDMDSLLSTSRITSRREQRSYWHLVTLTVLCVITVLAFIMYSL